MFDYNSPTARRIPTNASKYAIVRVSGQDFAKLQKHLFQRYPGREWGTFFLFGYRKTSWGLALSYVSPVFPEPGDLIRSSPIVEFNTSYIARAKDQAEKKPLALGVIHSHPQGCVVSPSPLDNDMDRYFGDFLSDFLPDRPYASLIISQTRDGQLCISGRIYFEGEWLVLKTAFGVEETNIDRFDCTEPQKQTPNLEQNMFSLRSQSLYGQVAMARIKSARLAVIGASGTGSPCIEMLARAEAGGLFIVDTDTLSPSNRERLHGSQHKDYLQDARPLKVDIAKRHVNEINPNVEVAVCSNSLLSDEVLDKLLQCDLAIFCVDTQSARAAIQYLKTHYLLPCLDTGVRMAGKEGCLRVQTAELAQYFPGSPCPCCENRVDWIQVSQELCSAEEKTRRQKEAAEAEEKGADPNQYWRESDPLTTVGYLTTAVGSLAAGYAIQWLTGVAKMPSSRFQFDVGQPYFGFLEIPRANDPSCNCQTQMGWSDQAKGSRLV
jgi:molybdopterin/thiamine biosynthesis adenylyltransferase